MGMRELSTIELAADFRAKAAEVRALIDGMQTPTYRLPFFLQLVSEIETGASNSIKAATMSLYRLEEALTKNLPRAERP